MKVLLIGGLGFIGKRFIRKFSDMHELIVYSTEEDIEKASKVMDLTKLTIEKGFVEDEKLAEIIEKYKPDVVVHLAALTGLVKCQKNPVKAFQVNVYGTYNVVNNCIRSSTKKLIFISSREVYGETISGSTREDAPLLPNNVYGITKMIGENIVKFGSKKNNLDFTILRLTNVYGPQGDQYGAQIIIQNALKDKKIKIFGGSQKLNYVYVNDVVEVINLVLNNPKASKQVFNVGSRDTITINDFGKKVIEIIGKDIKVENLPMRETETSNFEPNLEKLEKDLGFSIKTSLKEGIQNTIKWYSR